MGGLLRDLLLIDLLGQLIEGLARLLAVVIVLGVILWVACASGDGNIVVPGVGNVCDRLCRVVPFVPCPTTTFADSADVECPQFADAFPQLLPDTWSLRKVESISIDDDDESECLAVYEYNSGGGAFGGPLGGVVYDPQPDRNPQNMEVPAPYRPAAYVPYHLLPREDGKGFLSERVGDWGQMIQVYDANDIGDRELVLQGFGGYGFPSYLSIFQWVDKQAGYRLLTSPVGDEMVGGPLFGNAGIDIDRETLTDEQGNEIKGAITKVTVKTRPTRPFWYFRSQLCHAEIYRWNDDRTQLVQDDYYLTFCFGRPAGAEPRKTEYDLWYPEEALLAYYTDGEVREISIPTHPVRDTLQAIVTLRQGSQQRWLARWMLRENTDGQVGRMTFWYLEQIGQPYDP